MLNFLDKSCDVLLSKCSGNCSVPNTSKICSEKRTIFVCCTIVLLFRQNKVWGTMMNSTTMGKVIECFLLILLTFSKAKLNTFAQLGGMVNYPFSKAFTSKGACLLFAAVALFSIFKLVPSPCSLLHEKSVLWICHHDGSVTNHSTDAEHLILRRDQKLMLFVNIIQPCIWIKSR